MNSRERVKRALLRNIGMPDRVPIQFDLCKQLTEHFGRELGIKPDYSFSYYEDLTYRISANEIRTKLGSDVVVVGGTIAKGFVPKRIEGEIVENEFGMYMKPTPLYMEVVKCPLDNAESVEDIEGYEFPDANAEGRYDSARRDIIKYKEDYFIIGDCELSLFELAWHLTGMEKFLMGMALEEPWVEALVDRVEKWTTDIAINLIKEGVDAIWFGEDLGSQTSTLLSPSMWRSHYKPRYMRMIKKLKSINPDVLIIMHSDGAVAPLLDDFIEMGIEVYNPVQPNVPGTDPQELKDKYGDRISFFGGIDQQSLMPSGDKEAITAEVNRRIEILGNNAGYLLAPAHIIQADVSPETVRLLIDTVVNR